MSQLSQYYLQNYSTSCEKSKNYLDSPEFLSLGAKIIGLIGIPSNFFAYHVLIFKTPKFMRHMRGVLLNLKIWTLMIDLVYTVFLIPYVFYPIFAMGYIGIFSKVLGIPSEIQFYIAMGCYGGISSAGILIFENRQHHMIPKGSKFRIENKIYRWILVIFNVFLGASIMLVAMWLRDDGDDLKFKFLKLYACPDPLYFSPYTFAVDSNRNELSWAIATVLFTLSLQYTFFVSHCFYYIVTNQESSRYSKSTRKMQKMFLLASFSQISIFFMVIVIPLGVFAVVLTTGWRSQALLNICNLIIPTIGFNTTVAVIVTFKPYRQYFWSIFTKEPKETTVTRRENSHFTKSVVF